MNGSKSAHDELKEWARTHDRKETVIAPIRKITLAIAEHSKLLSDANGADDCHPVELQSRAGNITYK